MNAIRYSISDSEVANLQPHQIRIDGGTQSRARIDRETVDEYTEAVRRGDPFPKVVVFFDGKEYWLADGFHRWEAHVLAKSQKIAVDVRQGTLRDAVLFSVGANAIHGLRRTDADKRRAVQTLLSDDEWSSWSDREIARKCGVGHQMVGPLRASLTGRTTSDERTYTTKHGTVSTMNTTAIGKSPDLRIIDEVEDLIAGTALDNDKDRGRLKRLPPNEQVHAAKRDIADVKRKEANAASRQVVMENLPPSIQAIEAAKKEAIVQRSNANPSDGKAVEALKAELAEVTEILASQDAKVVELERENEQFAAMKQLFMRGGFEAVVAAKDEEIRTLKTRVSTESQDKAAWMRKANFWKEQATKLGWRDTRGENPVAPLADDDSFFDVVEGA